MLCQGAHYLPCSVTEAASRNLESRDGQGDGEDRSQSGGGSAASERLPLGVVSARSVLRSLRTHCAWHRSPCPFGLPRVLLHPRRSARHVGQPAVVSRAHGTGCSPATSSSTTRRHSRWPPDLVGAVLVPVGGRRFLAAISAETIQRAVVLPAMAPIGRMVVPAVIYAVVNAGGDGAGGESQWPSTSPSHAARRRSSASACRRRSSHTHDGAEHGHRTQAANGQGIGRLVHRRRTDRPHRAAESALPPQCGALRFTRRTHRLVGAAHRVIEAP